MQYKNLLYFIFAHIALLIGRAALSKWSVFCDTSEMSLEMPHNGHKVKTKHVQISNTLDTSITHQIPGQSTSLVKRLYVHRLRPIIVDAPF